MIRAASRVSLLMTALLQAACAGGQQGDRSEATPLRSHNGPAAPQAQQPDTAEPSSETPPQLPLAPIAQTIEEQYAISIMLFQGGSLDGEVDSISSRGFEFVIGAEREFVELATSITAHLPDGLTRELLPPATLTGLTGPSAFWGCYGTGEGLPGAGEFVFDFVLRDGRRFEKHVPVEQASVIDIARNITTEVIGDTMRVTWTAVAGARNYSVEIQEVDGGATLAFTDAGCETGDPSASPGAIPPTACRIVGIEANLIRGRNYAVSIGSWGFARYVDPSSPGDAVAAFSGNMSAALTW